MIGWFVTYACHKVRLDPGSVGGRYAVSTRNRCRGHGRAHRRRRVFSVGPQVGQEGRIAEAVVDAEEKGPGCNGPRRPVLSAGLPTPPKQAARTVAPWWSPLSLSLARRVACIPGSRARGPA